jgi:hypothetical protein
MEIVTIAVDDIDRVVQPTGRACVRFKDGADGLLTPMDGECVTTGKRSPIALRECRGV